MTELKTDDIRELFELPFLDLVYKAREVHQQHFKANSVELCTLLSIKTGACPEDCAYCPQSGHHNTGLKKEKLCSVDNVIEKAKIAKAAGSKRFCMGAAWRNPPKKDFPKVLEMIKAVKAMGMEACVTLGTLDDEQSQALKEAGLDYYNHNIDTSPRHYKNIITTRSYEERFETLRKVDSAGINTCCGGILGMGETRQDRIDFLQALSQLSQPPKSIPVNQLIPIKGTPLENTPALDNFEFIRTIAVTRILFPTSMVRLSAGREDMSEEMQAWCYMAGANSIFYGEVLLTAENPTEDADQMLLSKLGLEASKESLYA